MVKSRTTRIIVWLLCFALSVFLLFIIPNEFTQAMWVTLIFDVIAFVSQMILWMTVLGQVSESKGVFNRYPMMMVSIFYMMAELVMCIITPVIGTSLSMKTSLIINFVIMVIAWIIIVLLISSKNHVERLGSRQKDHHVEL